MATSLYRVREVDGDEYAEELSELHQATFANVGLADFAEGHWWIAFRGGDPVGFIGITQGERVPYTGYFERVGVLPGHRGHRLQRRLMRAMEAKARKLGWRSVVTDTRANPNSTNNIIAAGYRNFLPAEPWSFNDACYWTKDLTHGQR